MASGMSRPRGRHPSTGLSNRLPVESVFGCVGLLVIGLGIYAIFEYTSWMPVTRRGFFCNDQEIRYPLKESTFPSWAALFTFAIIPWVIFAFVELAIIRSARSFFYTFLHSACAFFTSGLTTDTIKCIVGRLRPYFIEICKPDVLVNFTCDAANAVKFITDYRCENEEARYADLQKARKSFPSGHSTTALCGSVFLSFYVWRRIPSSPPFFGRQIIVFLLLLLAVAVAVSRIMDHQHHQEDVLFGGMIGTIASVCCGVIWWRAMDDLDATNTSEGTTNSEVVDEQDDDVVRVPRLMEVVESKDVVPVPVGTNRNSPKTIKSTNNVTQKKRPTDLSDVG